MEIKRKPDWLKFKFPKGKNFAVVDNIVEKHHLHTICKSGKCPNIGECWDNGTATFMILGNICTRACKFCAVETGKPLPPDANEPDNIANAVKLMNLKHCVITSVDRDDLPDKGAAHWAATISRTKEINPHTTIEVLVPDFDGNTEWIKMVIDARPEIISHNLETVERLTPLIRTRAKYNTSLDVLKFIAQSKSKAKSGIMLGLGETETEILQTMDDLLAVGCKIMTIGQYLQPTKQNIAVTDYVTPEKFEYYKQKGIEKGFEHIESHPLVRSSFHAEKHI